eukprot:12398752-Karenia_brevis.AAC.1
MVSPNRNIVSSFCIHRHRLATLVTQAKIDLPPSSAIFMGSLAIKTLLKESVHNGELVRGSPIDQPLPPGISLTNA